MSTKITAKISTSKPIASLLFESDRIIGLLLVVVGGVLVWRPNLKQNKINAQITSWITDKVAACGKLYSKRKAV